METISSHPTTTPSSETPDVPPPKNEEPTTTAPIKTNPEEEVVPKPKVDGKEAGEEEGEGSSTPPTKTANINNNTPIPLEDSSQISSLLVVDECTAAAAASSLLVYDSDYDSDASTVIFTDDPEMDSDDEEDNNDSKNMCVSSAPSPNKPLISNVSDTNHVIPPPKNLITNECDKKRPIEDEITPPPKHLKPLPNIKVIDDGDKANSDESVSINHERSINLCHLRDRSLYLDCTTGNFEKVKTALKLKSPTFDIPILWIGITGSTTPIRGFICIKEVGKEIMSHILPMST